WTGTLPRNTLPNGARLGQTLVSVIAICASMTLALHARFSCCWQTTVIELCPVRPQWQIRGGKLMSRACDRHPSQEEGDQTPYHGVRPENRRLFVPSRGSKPSPHLASF